MKPLIGCLLVSLFATSLCAAEAPATLQSSDIPRSTQMGNPPAPEGAPGNGRYFPPMPTHPELPTLWLIGDSTVRNGTLGDGSNLNQWGWGAPIVAYFNPEKINVVNRAFGGTSSRSFYTGFFWQNLRPLIKKGDFVILQFGANDNGGAAGKGALKGVGPETEDVTRNGQTETVHTFGWYLEQYVKETRAQGATPIICSLTPRKNWTSDGHFRRDNTSHAAWAAEVAKSTGAPFVDLYEIIARRYESLGEDKVTPLYVPSPKENLHTGWDGAVINAECVIAGLKGLKENPLAPYFSDRANGVKAKSEVAEAGTNLPAPLRISGTNIVNDKGEPVLLRGVNAACLEWTSDGQGHILKTIDVAIQDWHANIIRLPLSQDRWFGKGPEQTDGGKSYRALVQQAVDTCATQKCYVILDLHWSDCNEWGANIGQHSMPDSNSIAFWQDFAPVYANHPAVLYDLYNEPHDVSWDVWLKGGEITDRPNTRGGGPPKNFHAVGMQQLLDTVRATGAKNVVIVGGLNWAYDYSGILAGRQLSDPNGNGVIYANHCYDNKGESVDKWIANMERASAKLPVMVTEFGGNSGPSHVVPSDNWLLHVIQALEEHHWSWTAWNLHTSARPNLVSDWNYTPTPGFGVYVKKALAAPAKTVE